MAVGILIGRAVGVVGNNRGHVGDLHGNHGGHGEFLRATVNYDDGDGADKDAAAVTSVAVGVDDDGSVSLSPSSPTVQGTVTATLTDPDGGVTGAIWQWAYSTTGTSNWNDISGANSRTYTVVAADVGSYLRASVSLGQL